MSYAAAVHNIILDNNVVSPMRITIDALIVDNMRWRLIWLKIVKLIKRLHSRQEDIMLFSLVLYFQLTAGSVSITAVPEFL